MIISTIDAIRPHTIKTACDCHNLQFQSQSKLYHAAPNTFFAHMSSQPSSVNIETLGNMHQCQQTSLGKIILLPSAWPSIILCAPTKFQCISLDLPAIGPTLYSLSWGLIITTPIIAMGEGGSYFLKRGVRKKGGSREPPEPPPGYGPADWLSILIRSAKLDYHVIAELFK